MVPTGARVSGWPPQTQGFGGGVPLRVSGGGGLSRRGPETVSSSDPYSPCPGLPTTTTMRRGNSKLRHPPPPLSLSSEFRVTLVRF